MKIERKPRKSLELFRSRSNYRWLKNKNRGLEESRQT